MQSKEEKFEEEEFEEEFEEELEETMSLQRYWYQLPE